MRVLDVVRKIEPTAMIGIMDRGLRGVHYIGRAMSAIERRDLVDRKVDEISVDLIDGARRLCIYVSN